MEARFYLLAFILQYCVSGFDAFKCYTCEDCGNSVGQITECDDGNFTCMILRNYTDMYDLTTYTVDRFCPPDGEEFRMNGCVDRIDGELFDRRCGCTKELCNDVFPEDNPTEVPRVSTSIQCYSCTGDCSDIRKANLTTCYNASCFTTQSEYDPILGLTSGTERGCWIWQGEERCIDLSYKVNDRRICFCNSDRCNDGIVERSNVNTACENYELSIAVLAVSMVTSLSGNIYNLFENN